MYKRFFFIYYDVTIQVKHVLTRHFLLYLNLKIRYKMRAVRLTRSTNAPRIGPALIPPKTPNDLTAKL